MSAAVIRRGHLMFAACAGMALFGVSLVLLGTLFGLPDSRVRLGIIDQVRQGDLQSLFFGGVLAATIIVGPTIDRFGNKLVLVTSSILVALSLTAFAIIQSYELACLCGVVLGLGGGGLNTSTNALVSDVYSENRGAKLNLLGMCFGIGAFLLPLLASKFAVPVLAVGVAAIAALCALLYLLLAFPAAHEAHTFSFREALRVARYPGVLAFAFLLFFQSGDEAMLAGWTSTWAGSLGASTARATQTLAAFQAAMMAGRIVVAAVVGRIGKKIILAAACAASVVACGLMLAAPSPATLAGAVVLTGLAFAPIYPTTLAVAGDAYKRFAGTMFGVLFTIALMGGTLFPRVGGHISQAYGGRSAMLLPLVGSVAILIILLSSVLRHAQPERTKAQVAVQN